MSATTTTRHAAPASTAVLAVLALVLSTLAAVVGVAVVAPASPASAAPAPFKDHAGLVPATPARGFPLISDQPTIRNVNNNCPNGCDTPREVLATDQVGRYIVSGGNFLTVELQDGTVLDQPYFTATNIDTKQVACAGLRFDNEVLKVLPGNEPDTVYVAGRFAKITDASGVARTRNRIAKINLTTCKVDTVFTSPATNAKIDDLALLGNRLFVGGDFTSVGGQAISTLAELDATTGKVVPSFSFGFSGGLSSRIRGMDVSPDGSRLLVAGRFGTMTGNGVSVLNPTAVVDITGASPRLTAHSSTGYTNTNGATMPIKNLQDASFSPDGGVVGLAYGTATTADYVYLTPMTEAAGTRYRWRHYMRDSSFGIGVSNNAVYVTGHFCKPDAGPGPSEVMEPVAGITDDCTGSRVAGGVWRSKLAALSLTDGTPLTWNPGSHSFRGGQVVTVTTRGLLVGFDGNRTANIRTGALAFFDLGAGVEDGAGPSDVTITAPTAGSTVGNPATFEGRATDDVGIASFDVAVRTTDGGYLQEDGTLGTARYVRSVTATATGTFSYQATMPAGAYTVEAVAVDVVGKTSASVASVAFTQSGVDGAKPVSTLAAPASADVDQPLRLSGTASDNEQVRQLQLRVKNAAGAFLQPDGTFSSAQTNLPLATDVALPARSFSWTAELSGLPADTYTVTARAVDSAGNPTTATRTVTLGVVAPTVSISSPGDVVEDGQAALLAGTASDAGAVAEVEVSLADAAGNVLLDDGTVAAAANTLPATVDGLGTGSASWSYTTPVLPAGTWTLTATARDAGGASTTQTRTFRQRAAVVSAISAYTGFATGSTTGTLGYTFTVDAPTTLSAIGVQDTNLNGRIDNGGTTGAGLWRQGNATALATTSVPANATATNGWAFGALATPIVLEPGVTYVVGTQYSRGERYASGGTVTTVPGVRITGRASVTSFFDNGLRYPGSFSAGTGYGMPNLRLQQ